MDRRSAPSTHLWPLLPHNQRQQLVLQALQRNSEINQRALGLNLGRVVGVAQLRVHVQPEVRV